MKKFVLSVMTIGAMFFGSQNLQAQEEEVEEIETEVEVEIEHDEFTAVEVSALPQEVKVAIMKDYNGAFAKEAWVKREDDTKIYKVKLDIKGETKKVYIDQDGNWLEEDEKDDSDK